MASRRQQLSLDHQLCFALYAASRALTAAYRPRLAQLGLTYTQYVVVLLLLEHGTLPMHELGRRLQLDSATLSPLLKRMEAQALVTRRRTADDERVVEVDLTEAGRALRDDLAPLQHDIDRATGLGHGQRSALRDDLHGLTAHLHTEGAADR